MPNVLTRLTNGGIKKEISINFCISFSIYLKNEVKSCTKRFIFRLTVALKLLLKYAVNFF